MVDPSLISKSYFEIQSRLEVVSRQRTLLVGKGVGRAPVSLSLSSADVVGDYELGCSGSKTASRQRGDITGNIMGEIVTYQCRRYIAGTAL